MKMWKLGKSNGWIALHKWTYYMGSPTLFFEDYELLVKSDKKLTSKLRQQNKEIWTCLGWNSVLTN